MATEPGTEQPEPAADVDTELIDLTGLTLSDLEVIDRSALGVALRWILARHEDPSDPVVALQRICSVTPATNVKGP